MLRVEECLPDGRVRVLEARAVPVAAGPMRFAVGRMTGRPEPASRRRFDDDLCALALAVGVMG